MAILDPLPVTVVTGFLGAGKTTLVNRWLGDVARGVIAVVVNEHGAVGIDGALLAARVRHLVEIAGGCVCCTTQAELVAALAALARATPRPERVLVETSGAASPAGVVRAIAASAEGGGYVLDGIVDVLDATRAAAVLAEHDLAIEQLGYADLVVLSRSDRLAAVEERAVADLVALHNPAALVVHGRHGAVDEAPTLPALLARRSADLPPMPAAPHRRHREHYESVALALDGPVDGERFADFVETELARVAGRIFRTKGILAVDEVPERMILQGVGTEVELTFGAPWDEGAPRTSRLVVIGFGLDGAALAEGFRACARG